MINYFLNTKINLLVEKSYNCYIFNYNKKYFLTIYIIPNISAIELKFHQEINNYYSRILFIKAIEYIWKNNILIKEFDINDKLVKLYIEYFNIKYSDYEINPIALNNKITNCIEIPLINYNKWGIFKNEEIKKLADSINIKDSL